MKRTASALWRGDLKSGQGTVSTASGVLSNSAYSFHTRFEDGKGTNPEELLAAAHAGCFSMALALMLGEAGLAVERIETHAAVSLDKVDGSYAIVASHLTVVAVVPGASAAQFAQIANQAKTGCPVSKLLKASITMDARLGTSPTDEKSGGRQT